MYAVFLLKNMMMMCKWWVHETQDTQPDSNGQGAGAPCVYAMNNWACGSAIVHVVTPAC